MMSPRLPAKSAEGNGAVEGDGAFAIIPLKYSWRFGHVGRGIISPARHRTKAGIATPARCLSIEHSTPPGAAMQATLSLCPTSPQTGPSGRSLPLAWGLLVGHIIGSPRRVGELMLRNELEEHIPHLRRYARALARNRDIA